MFSRACIEDAKKHMVLMYPYEGCGIIWNDNGVEKFSPLVNLHDKPDTDFIVDVNEIKKITGAYDNYLALLHSHPSANLALKSCPSKTDMKSQLASGKTWGIIDSTHDHANEPYWFGEFNLDTDIYGQQFHAGVNDCYTLIRKWYWQNRGIKLTEYPRDDSWWNNNENMYVDNFEATGFRQISKEELQDGDVFLMSVLNNNGILNHGAIFLDNKVDGKQLMAHHLPNRLSRREAATLWLNKAEKFLRYVGNVKKD